MQKKLWNPTTAQLEIIAELSHAHAPVDVIAKLSPRSLRAWQERLKTAAAAEAERPVAVEPEEETG
jgi:hypothetical protein